MHTDNDSHIHHLIHGEYFHISHTNFLVFSLDASYPRENCFSYAVLMSVCLNHTLVCVCPALLQPHTECWLCLPHIFSTDTASKCTASRSACKYSLLFFLKELIFWMQWFKIIVIVFCKMWVSEAVLHLLQIVSQVLSIRIIVG